MEKRKETTFDSVWGAAFTRLSQYFRFKVLRGLVFVFAFHLSI